MANPYYHKTTRNMISLFGSIFNNIMIRKFSENGTVELERIRVPIEHAEKEKFYERLKQDPDLQKEVGITLPRMSYAMTGISYDRDRSKQELIQHQKEYNSTTKKQHYVGIPYDLKFELAIAVRNRDDGFQIVEQILPIFKPDLTLSVNLLSEMGRTYDIPIILDSINETVDYEGDMMETRVVYWELMFTMKTWFVGPIDNQGIIKTVFANTYNDPALTTGYIIEMTVGNGNNGTFKIEDVVYQGPSKRDAHAYGVVLDWYPNNSILRVGAAQGTFVTNSNVRTYETNASYNVVSFSSEPLKLSMYKVHPDPTTANTANESHGYTETYTEYI